jgi:ferredoxin
MLLTSRKGKSLDMSEENISEERITGGSTWPVPQIDPTRCDGCGLCVKVCPTQVLVIREGLAVVAFPARCNYTGFCERVCPTHAIQRFFEIVWPDETFE